MSLSHHTLVAWQRADDLFIKLHQLSLKAFPAFERFELGSQLRRAAFSVPVNIVEGFAKPKGRARCGRARNGNQTGGSAAGGPHSLRTSSDRCKDRRNNSRGGLLHDSTRVTCALTRGRAQRL